MRGRYLGEAAAVAAPEPYKEAANYVFRKTLAAFGAPNDHFTDLSQFIDKDADFELTDLACVRPIPTLPSTSRTRAGSSFTAARPRPRTCWAPDNSPCR